MAPSAHKGKAPDVCRYQSPVHAAAGRVEQKRGPAGSAGAAEPEFLCYEGKGPVPEHIHAYLSKNWKELRNLPKDDPALVTKARDRWYVPDPKTGRPGKLREKALLREFEEIRQTEKKSSQPGKGSGMRRFGLVSRKPGRKKITQPSYMWLKRSPNKVLEEDPNLLMWYDQAVTRMGGINA